MAKVFRLFSDKMLQDWEERGEPYGPSVIGDIENPDGDASKKDPTSIPSPFARMDLVRAAFKYVADSGDLDGNTIYHKLVSECFDVGEMFFNADKLTGKIQIKSWDKKVHLDLLKNATNPKHQLLGETLELYLNQDAESNNFKQLQKIYFLLYESKIVGATSPVSMFLSSANDLSFARLKMGNDVLFDSNCTPLYKRDIEFQEYIYQFSKAYPDIATNMRDFNDYLVQNLRILDSTNKNLYSHIKQFEEKSSTELIEQLNRNYEPLDTGTAGENIELFGHPLKKKKIANRIAIIKEQSGFVMTTTKNDSKPLVLQNKFSEPLPYTDASVLWNNHWEVPYEDNRLLADRILPGQLDQYPYVTVSDFLEPYLIRLSYPLNNQKYFDGNLSYEGGDDTKHYVLPLTKTFFDFFDTSDLMKTTPDGKPMFEMVVYPNSVEVKLRVPIKGNTNVQYVNFFRTYDNPIAQDDGTFTPRSPDNSANKGAVIENIMSLAIYPFLKMNNGENAFYKVMMLDSNFEQHTKKESFELTFHQNKENKQLSEPTKKVRSLKTERSPVGTGFYSVNQQFDYIHLKNQHIKGVILPKFEEVENHHKKFSFAVDFGTTNTHIEYTIDDANPQPFEITLDDLQFAALYAPDAEHKNSHFIDARAMAAHVRHELLPETIGINSEFYFPIRTALNENAKENTALASFAFADYNIPFDYQKYTSKVNSRISTNLKWDDGGDSLLKIERFFKKLLFLIRNKVLLNQGDLTAVQLYWFYPSSMWAGKLDALDALWRKLFHTYINSKSTPVKISESIAPYYYYKNVKGINAADRPVVSLDIGGGTSDMVVYQGKNPLALTSFRFAANAIFGDAYGNSPSNNGFVLKYKDVFKELLLKNKLWELCGVFDQIIEKKKSEDFSTFLFSLENNTSISEKNIPISYNDILKKDEELKIVFITFYAAIIYHLAKLMKVKELKAPRNIIFSGTGSKTLALIDVSHDFNKLERLTNIIFAKVYQQKEVEKIELVIGKQPKEITCKGGLLMNGNVTEVNGLKTVLLGDKNNQVIPETSLKYAQLDNETTLESVVVEVSNFIDLLFEVNNEFSLTQNFGISATNLNDYRNILQEDLMQHLKSGIEHKIAEINDDVSIDLEESLFFYPLVGALNRLAYEIAKQPHAN